jgi:hypothetical protein
MRIEYFVKDAGNCDVTNGVTELDALFVEAQKGWLRQEFSVLIMLHEDNDDGHSH